MNFRPYFLFKLPWKHPFLQLLMWGHSLIFKKTHVDSYSKFPSESNGDKIIMLWWWDRCRVFTFLIRLHTVLMVVSPVQSHRRTPLVGPTCSHAWSYHSFTKSHFHLLFVISSKHTVYIWDVFRMYWALVFFSKLLDNLLFWAIFIQHYTYMIQKTHIVSRSRFS